MKIIYYHVSVFCSTDQITTMKATCDRLIMQVRVAPDCYGDPNRSAIYHIIMERFSSLVCIDNIIHCIYHLI